MPLSMYQASVPVFTRSLSNLSNILAKGAAFAESRKIEPSVLINSRLAPDMLPLFRQVQIAADMVMRGTARLAGAEVTSVPDTETSFPELQQRIAKARKFAENFTAAQIDGSETKKLTIPVGDREFVFTGQDYLFNFVLPNLFFHSTATYLILRHNGVELGKMDFLGS